MRKKATKDQRELKVYTKYALSKYGKASVLPEIRLKGNWVSEIGFTCGDKITIFENGNTILIRNKKDSLSVIIL